MCVSRGLFLFFLTDLLFLKELQAKKPKGISLVFNTDPYEGVPETDHFLSSRGIRQRGENYYMSLEKFVYEYNMTLENLEETLIGLQQEIERYNIKVDWKKIFNLSSKESLGSLEKKQI